MMRCALGSLHLPGESGHGEESGGSQAVISSLQEAVMVIKEALAGLEEAKVPAGVATTSAARGV